MKTSSLFITFFFVSVVFPLTYASFSNRDKARFIREDQYITPREVIQAEYKAEQRKQEVEIKLKELDWKLERIELLKMKIEDSIKDAHTKPKSRHK